MLKSNKHTRTASCAGFAFLLTAFAASAQVALPPPSSKVHILNMVDARENLKASYQNSLSARPGLAQSGLTNARNQAKAIAAAAATYKKFQPHAEIVFSNLTGAPRMIVNAGHTLTSSSGAGSDTIARNFLTQHRDLFGFADADLADLTTLGDSKGGSSGLRMLRLEQRVAGRPIFQSETRFLIKRDGSLAEILGQMIPGAHAAAAQTDWSNAMSAQDAAVALLNSTDVPAQSSDFTAADGVDGRIELTSTNASVSGGVTARQVLFPLSPGVLIPAWSVVAFTTGTQDWYGVVDAQTGDLLWRKNIRDYASAQDARFRVYVQPDGLTPAPSPAPNSAHVTVNPGDGTQFPAISPQIVSMHAAYDPLASPNGWIDDCPAGGCTASQTQTLGNNVLACIDQANPANTCDTGVATVLDGNGRPTGNPDANSRNRDFLGTTPRDFQTNFLPPPQGGNPEAGQTATGNGSSGTAPIDQFRRGVVTHLFYSLNWYHDKLFELGFDEAAGNFQQTNFSGMGLGGDRVLADVDDGSGTNNANFSTPPDGTSGRMQMYRFTGPTIDRDGALDAEVFLHEATHGVSNRLIGDGAGLNWDSGGGMGEGWSDFVALSLLYNTNGDDPNAEYASGAYATYKFGAVVSPPVTYLDNYVYGIRRFPYSTDNTVNPLTWADVDDVTNDLSGGITPTPIPNFNAGGAFEVHNIGELWANTLWGVRARIIADPAGANHDVPTGNHTALQLVIDGLKATPIDPSFTDARDAILNADCDTNNCANETSIWDGFAYRGLGYGASQPYNKTISTARSHVGVQESFKSPYLDVVNAHTDVIVDDSVSNNNGVIDPGEAVKLAVTLTNPWRGASKAATGVSAVLSTSTPGVTIYGDSATYADIPAQSTGAGSSFVVGVDPAVPCGTAIDFTITTTSSLGTTDASFRVRVGGANGTDAPITYTDTIAGGLAIPDASSRGVFHQLSITDDFEIASVNYRIDNLTHTFVGDLSLMLRSPSGVGVDMIGLIGLDVDGGPGDNLINTVVDDSIPATSATDMIEAPAADAPYAGPWVPLYNSPIWADPTFFGLPGDSVGNLSRFIGKSTKGIWTTLAADQAAFDTGTLNAWSIIVTPVHFTCSASTFGANVSATKTAPVALADVGATVTYTVTLTNNGAGVQNDNPGDEFSDVLPANLTLVDASSSSGTAVATVGTNTVTWNGSVAPLGGTVTITIDATINPNPGATVSNQGTVSYDSNGDGTNDATAVTDDPDVGGAADPTVFTMNSAHVTATKTVTGAEYPYGIVTYTIVLANDGTADTLDNVGPEFTDVLPAELHLHSAVASSGTISVAISGSQATVNWNGSIAAGDSVTITIQGQVNAGTEFTTVSNQGTFQYNSYEGTTNDVSGLTDDPTIGGVTDPTTFIVSDEIFKDGFGD